MHALPRTAPRNPVRKPLAATVAACLLLAAPATSLAASNWLVTNCNDSGENSLRDIVDHKAASGDSVDLSYLICGTIELTSGTITIDQKDLSLRGPESTALVIAVNNDYPFAGHIGPVLKHDSTGTLTLSHLTITSHVDYVESAYGGCIDAHGNLALDKVVISNCVARSSSSWSMGGGIRVKGNLTMLDSQVRNNGLASDSVSGWMRGGGVAVEGDLDARNSVIENNTVDSQYSAPVYGGGVWVGGNANLNGVEIRGNAASQTSEYYGTIEGGGLSVGGDLTMVNSVVSGNVASAGQLALGGGIHATGNLVLTDVMVLDNSAIVTNTGWEYEPQDYSGGGGIWSEGPFALLRTTVAGNHANTSAGIMLLDATQGDQREIANSTISGNQAITAPAGIYAIIAPSIHNSTIAFNAASTASSVAGAGIRGMLGIELESCLVSGNTNGANADDVAGPVTGSHNLIFAPGAYTVPADTLTGIDPMLGSLSINGGITLTLPLMAGSPAIDHGANPDTQQWDQRGNGFARVIGFSADIGAYEFNPDALPEVIFHNGFD
ncbi:MAG TPA: choice-of-anchor Q domain-containing protein [Rhodanobacteraceae bacterium]|nr:choice-of-anchor Q domain-containing protein [Rhodanobacteraceae bacterium]